LRDPFNPPGANGCAGGSGNRQRQEHQHQDDGTCPISAALKRFPARELVLRPTGHVKDLSGPILACQGRHGQVGIMPGGCGTTRRPVLTVLGRSTLLARRTTCVPVNRVKSDPGRVQHPPNRSIGDHQSRTRPGLFGGSNGPYSATFNMTAYQQGIVGPFGRRPRGPWFRPRPAGLEIETGLVAGETFEGSFRTGQPEPLRPAVHQGSVPWVQRTWPVWIVLVPFIAIWKVLGRFITDPASLVRQHGTVPP